MDLLKTVLRCWVRMCQTLTTLSPILAANRSANFEGMGFILDETFDHLPGVKEVWKLLMNSIIDNVVSWYESDVYSKKLGLLFEEYVNTTDDSLEQVLVILLLAKQRPPGWEQVVRAFILKSDKNSFYLSKVQALLWYEFRASFASERVRQELRSLAAMCVAKHSGAKNPSATAIEKTASILEKRDANRRQTPPALPGD
jgi:hypothetical protein